MALPNPGNGKVSARTLPGHHVTVTDWLDGFESAVRWYQTTPKSQLTHVSFCFGMLRRSQNVLEVLRARSERCSMSLWSKTMQPRLALLGVTTVAAIALLIWGAAYTSLYIFRDAPHQKSTPRSTPLPVSATSSTATGVSNIYNGARIIVVCSELDETQKSRTSCP